MSKWFAPSLRSTTTSAWRLKKSTASRTLKYIHCWTAHEPCVHTYCVLSSILCVNVFHIRFFHDSVLDISRADPPKFAQSILWNVRYSGVDTDLHQFFTTSGDFFAGHPCAVEEKSSQTKAPKTVTQSWFGFFCRMVQQFQYWLILFKPKRSNHPWHQNHVLRTHIVYRMYMNVYRAFMGIWTNFGIPLWCLQHAEIIGRASLQRNEETIRFWAPLQYMPTIFGEIEFRVIKLRSIPNRCCLNPKFSWRNLGATSLFNWFWH